MLADADKVGKSAERGLWILFADRCARLAGGIVAQGNIEV